MLFTAVLPTVLALASVPFVAEFRLYSLCMGRQETFEVDLDNISISGEDMGIMNHKRFCRLPAHHPYKLLSWAVLGSYSIVVPTIYTAIYRFRKRHDNSVPGTSISTSFIIVRNKKFEFEGILIIILIFEWSQVCFSGLE